MEHRELIRRIRKIEIVTKGLVNDLMAGQYHSVFKGQGMSFDEVREYQPGDDVRMIDWNVSARMSSLFVKKFVEERELTVMLSVDVSGSQAFGTRVQRKSELAAELAALLAFSAIENNDRVGLVLFSDRVERFVPPKKGRTHVLSLVMEILDFKAEGQGTSVAAGLEYLSKVTKRRSVAFLISDFLDARVRWEKALKITNRKHDLIPVVISDPAEDALPPDCGLLWMEDPETGAVVPVDTGDAGVRASWERQAGRDREDREELFRRLRIDFVNLRTDQPYVKPLMTLFKRRAARQ